MAVMEIIVRAIDQASQVIDNIAQRTEGLSGAVNNAGHGMMTAGKGMQAAGAQMTMMSVPILAAGAGLGLLTKEAMSFEKGMAETFTLLPGISKEAMAGMIEETKNFSKEMGVLPEKTIPALYQALSAGVPPGNVFDFLEVGQQAALGGVTDLTTAVDGITSVVNAFGSETITAGDASDKMFTAVRLGKTTFEELSRSLFNVNPIAAALGVNFGDVTGALSTMTAQGTPTSVATTQLRQMFVELSKEGGQAAKTFEGLAGKSFKDFIASGGNVGAALNLMAEHATQSGKGINDLFGSVEAGSAALALSGENAARYASDIEAMANSAGATETAFDTMADTGQHAADKAAAAFAVMRGELGEKFLPILTDTLIPIFQNSVMPMLERFFEVVGKVAEGFGKLPTPIQGVLLGLVGFLAVGGPILMMLGSITQMAGSLVIGLSKIPAALGFLGQGFQLVGGFVKLIIPGFLAAAKAAWVFTAALLANPITWIVLAIIALIAIIVLLVKNWDAVSAALVKAWEWIKQKAVEVWEGLKEFFAVFWDGVKDLIARAWEAIKNILLDYTMIGQLIKNWDTIKEKAGELWEWLKTKFSEGMEAIKAAAQAAWDAFKENIITKWEEIKEQAGLFWEAIKTKFSEALEAVRQRLEQGMSAIRDFMTSTWTKIKDTIISLWEAIKNGVAAKAGALKDKVIETVNAAVTFIKELPGKAIQWGKDIISGLINGIKQMAGKAIEAITGVVNGIVTKAKNLLKSKSPSQVFGEIGADVTGGLAGGITGTESGVLTAIEGVINKMIKAPGNAALGFNINGGSPAFATAGGPVIHEHHFSGVIKLQGDGVQLDRQSRDQIIEIVIDELRQEVRT